MSTHFLDKIILKKILDRFKSIKFYKYNIYIYFDTNWNVHELKGAIQKISLILGSGPCSKIDLDN